MMAHAAQLGLLLGLRHASDADHVCTVASLLRAGEGRWHALRMAVWWGLGHSTSFFAVGAALLLFDLRLPVVAEKLVELTVALLLVVLGVTQWRHAPCPVPHHSRRAKGHTSAAVGLVHGLAGSAGVSLLALTSLGDRQAALLYLFVCGADTVLGMVLVTLVLSLPLGLAARLDARWQLAVLRAAAASSIALGLWLFFSSHLGAVA